MNYLISASVIFPVVFQVLAGSPQYIINKMMLQLQAKAPQEIE